MGRFLKIAVYIAVLFLGYLWIATVAKSCNKSETANSEDTELVEDIASEDEFADDFFDDENEESEESLDEALDEMGGGSTIEDDYDLVDSSPMDYTEVDEIIEDTKPANQTHSDPIRKTSVNNNSSESGKYLLLAGSYLIEDNASIMVNKLKKMGYNDAEIVVFEMSQYHSVCAGRFSNMSTANQESSSLKRQGVDNYVHTKQ